MFGCRPNSNRARICVLGFSANRVWLVSRLYIFTIYYKARTFSIPTINTIEVCELSWPNGKRKSLNSEVRKTQVRSPARTCFVLFLSFFFFVHFVFHFLWFSLFFNFLFLFFILFFIHFIFMFHYIWFFITSVGHGRLAAAL